MPRAKTRPDDAKPVRLELTPEENELVEQAAQVTGERYRSVFARRVVVEAARAVLAKQPPAAGRPDQAGARKGPGKRGKG